MNTDLLSVSVYLLKGFGTTFKIFTVTLFFALPAGLIVNFGAMSKFKPLKLFVRAFVWAIRGTPLMLQLIVVYYGPGLLSDGEMMLGCQAAVYITFIINYACYFSEIYRGGVESIAVGQYEAAQVLGMTKAQTFFHVILFQVVKRIVPPMSNEIINLVKDTSLARIITVYEIIFFAQEYIRGAGIIWPLFYTGVYYLVFTGLLTLLFGWIEKKMDYYRG